MNAADPRRKNAQGLMQLIPVTARGFGVRKVLARLAGWRDHPFDPKVTPPSDLLPLICGPVRRR